MMLRHLDLFSGIGGFALGLQMTRHYKTVGFVEIDSFCQKVLASHWPSVPIYGDIHDVSTDTFRDERIGILTAGFNCQPFSRAGSRRGIEDERFLWTELYRIIAGTKPRFLILENSNNLIRIQQGVAFGGILFDLVRLGYSVEWGVIPALAAGAAHIRDRLWIVAYSNSHRQHEPGTPELSADTKRHAEVSETGNQITELRQTGSDGEILVNSGGTRWEKCNPPAEPGSAGYPTWRCDPNGQNGKSKPAVGRVLDGVPAQLERYRLRLVALQGQPQFDHEPPRVIDDKLPHHAARVKALGNAVVPQIVAAIGECIWKFHTKE